MPARPAHAPYTPRRFRIALLSWGLQELRKNTASLVWSTKFLVGLWGSEQQQQVATRAPSCPDLMCVAARLASPSALALTFLLLLLLLPFLFFFVVFTFFLAIASALCRRQPSPTRRPPLCPALPMNNPSPPEVPTVPTVRAPPASAAAPAPTKSQVFFL